MSLRAAIWVVLIAAWIMLVACAPTTYRGVYTSPTYDSTLLLCSLEEAPNGERILFCYKDETRGTW